MVSETLGKDTTTYTFDQANQLISSMKNKMATDYAYDQDGRLISETNNKHAVTRSYDPSGRLAIKTITEADDEESNESSWAYTYDPDGLLTKLITTNSDDDDDDDHDDKGDDDEGDDHDDEGDDDQVQITERRFTWDKMNGIAQILSIVTNGQETNLVYGYNRAFDLQKTKSSYYSYDAYGSAISKDDKDLSISKDFDIWGYSENENESIGFGYRAELHLGDDIYLRDRLYDPLTKRFVTKDKLSGVEGQTTLSNPYHYADNDPINKIDPLGLSPMTDDDVRVMGTTTTPSYPSTGTTSLQTTTTQQGSNKSKSSGGYYAAGQTGDDERNQFGCLIDWPDGNRPYLRSSSGKKKIGQKARFSCPQNPGKMKLTITVYRRRGWFGAEEMASESYPTLTSNTLRPKTLAARCAGGTHTYWAIVVGEAWGPPPRYSRYAYTTPSARLTC